jgi:hypothetical protein
MYTINPAADNSPDEPFFGFRLYWQQSFGGQFIADYEAGLVLGQADLDANNTDNFDALKAVPHPQRDNGWNARLDGYTYATYKARGRTSFGRYL